MITLEQVLKAYEYADSHPHEYFRGTTNWCAAVAHSLNEHKPAAQHQGEPVSNQSQCEECKGWGYHENHYEGGGTECGECGGSGNATVAVVMPERQIVPDTLMAGLTRKWCEGWNDALEEVARLNGVKP